MTTEAQTLPLRPGRLSPLGDGGGSVSGSSPESERGASPCLAVIQTVRGPSLGLSSPRKLDGLRPVLFSRDEFVDRRGGGPPTRTVAIGGSERILVRSSRLQFQFRLGGMASGPARGDRWSPGQVRAKPAKSAMYGGDMLRELTPTGSLARQLFNQPLHDIVQGLPPHANPAHRSLQFVMPAVSRQEVRPGIARVPSKGPRCVRLQHEHGRRALRDVQKIGVCCV